MQDTNFYILAFQRWLYIILNILTNKHHNEDFQRKKRSDVQKVRYKKISLRLRYSWSGSQDDHFDTGRKTLFPFQLGVPGCTLCSAQAAVHSSPRIPQSVDSLLNISFLVLLSMRKLFWTLHWKTWSFFYKYFRCLQNNTNADSQFKFTYRGPVIMKGKAEPMKVWYLSRRHEAKPTARNM